MAEPSPNAVGKANLTCHLATDVNGDFRTSELKSLVEAGGPRDWIVLGPKGVDLHPEIVLILDGAASGRPEVGIFYGDSVVRSDSELFGGLVLRPDWDINLYMADDYIGLPIFARPTVIRSLLHWLRTTEDIHISVYQLMIRAHLDGVPLARVPTVLTRSEHSLRADVTTRQRVIENHAVRLFGGEIEISPGLVPDSLRIEKVFDDYPEITILIPTRQSPNQQSGRPMVIELLESLPKTEYPLAKVTVLIGDDLKDEEVYRGRKWPFKLQRIVMERSADEPFNYAAKMNRLWRESKTEYIVMMNDDVVVQGGDWLQSLLTYCTQQSIGGVGARLLYPDGKIQHAGMVGGIYGLCTHAWIGEDAATPTYGNWSLLPKAWSMVTGAVFATRRSVLEEVNGLDERFRLDFNDVDLCMKMRMAGYSIVYTPFAEMTHREKGSRAAGSWTGSELAMFLRRWGDLLENDPASHPGLSKSTHILTPLVPQWGWWIGRP